MSKVRGGWEELPHSPTPEARGSGQEELPHAPKPEAKGGGGKEQPHDQGWCSGREDQPYIQGAVAARAREGLEELSHVEDQEGRR